MSTLKLKGSTSGYVELTAPATAGNNTITLPTTAGTVAVKDASNNVEVGTGVTIGSPSSNVFTVSTNGSERVRVDSSGRLAVGTTPATSFHVSGSGDQTCTLQTTTAGADNRINFRSSTGTDAGGIWYMHAGNHLLFNTGGSNGEKARIDGSGRLLLGTSTARDLGQAGVHQLQVEGLNENLSSAALIANVNSSAGPYLTLAKTRGTSNGSNTVVSSGDSLGSIQFNGADGTDIQTTGARISVEVDGTPGSNDMPGRLVFSTTADGASSPTERGRVNSSGYWKFSNSGSYDDSSTTSLNHYLQNNESNQSVFIATAWNNSYATVLQQNTCLRAANSAYSFFKGVSGNGSTSYADNEFDLRGDGNAYADGSWNGGGADYAEYFEWSDANPDEEDRRGISVVLDENKIREAVAGEDPIGVISGNPSVVGDAAWNKWSGKYLRDEYGTYVQEDYEVTDEDGNTVIQQRRKLNPEYDPDVEYVSREERPEWDCVGLMGKLRVRKGQITGSRWIKMRDVSATVEEWLVR